MNKRLPPFFDYPPCSCSPGNFLILSRRIWAAFSASASSSSVFRTNSGGALSLNVRQGLPLWENLTRIVQGEELKPYISQMRYLGLIGTGDKKAIASWANWGWQSPIL